MFKSKILVVLENFDIQANIFSSLEKSEVEISSIMPCPYKDAGLFYHDQDIKLALIEINNYKSQEALELIDSIRSANRSIKIVPIIHSKDSDLIFNLIKRGIDDVLLFPIDKLELKTVLNKFNEDSSVMGSAMSDTNFSRRERGKVITISSYKGGTGVSTVTANLGFCLAEMDAINKKTLIIDLANQSNHCSVILDAELSLNINMICRDVNRMESAFIASTCTWISQNLALIGTDPGIEGVQPVDYQALKRAIRMVSETFDFILIDLPTHTFDGRFLACMESSDEVITISTLDITSIRDTKLYLKMLKELGVDPSKIRLLVNRYDSESGMFKIKDLEHALQSPISYYLPNDFMTCTTAVQAGESILETNPQSMLAEAFADLAIRIDTGTILLAPPKSESKRKPKRGLASLFKVGN